ncbi:MAG: zinc-ribbon domain-containing protein [Ruminococcus sp.]|nr:zinc-ribbon domain-containing protein [Ruminococcus sp.]
MFCTVCGTQNPDGAELCVSCGAALKRAVTPAPEMQPAMQDPAMQQPMQQPAYAQELSAIGQALYDYCKVKLDPQLSKGGMAAGIIIGVLLLAFGLFIGVYQIALVGFFAGVIVAVAVWGTYVGAKKEGARLKSIFSRDGEEFVLREFASAQSFAQDQFRMSGFYIFARAKGIFRVVSVERVTRVKESTNFIPTGVRLDVLISDETDTTNVTLCRLHMTKSQSEAEELYNEIVARKQFAYEQMYQANR